MPPFFRAPRPVRALELSLLVIPLLMTLACQGSGPEDALEQQSPRLVLEPGQLVVSLTFDDARASQVNAASLLEARGLRGTFFVSSGRLGIPGYLTLDQIRRFQAAGHEVGGHTVSHVQLPTLDVDSQRRQVCDDRVALMNAGLRVTSKAAHARGSMQPTRAGRTPAHPHERLHAR
ncbi:polysaccharide deacetylase family protein [Corallococcus carmarthensis]|uniref:NodB homology domain-containing protein n=1 Tax=Corallococcus carmarthensis TaxID=2316728 RepID=A0A3A8KXD4_9BACT|nr:polysaccharide deacetylase family protein [Corallococcus carmarthensis]NOK16802.1 polysaccharide deacetylase family protein [Corallococcus carmarthensis]RKH06664.1 hypothetical protein D7X32_04490 [Corallococcus carmarthensis]